MPLVTETDKPTPGKHRWRAAWLLLFPPALVVALLLTVAVQPLQLGPYVLIGGPFYSPRSGWRPVWGHLPAPSNPVPVNFRNHRFTLTGEGWAFALSLGDWQCGLACFRGHRGP